MARKMHEKRPEEDNRYHDIFTPSNAILPKRVCTDTASPRSRGAP